MEKIIHTVLEVGLEKPVKILHVTDVHIAMTNDSDSEAHKVLEARRVNVFRKEGEYPPFTPSEYFEEAVALAEELDALLVVTGDVMDIQTNGNIEEFHRIADGHDMMFTPGGHEHQKRCHITLDEPDGYWMTARQRLKDAFPEFDMDFSNRIINGLNIVCADNSLDYYNAETVRRFYEELDKGLPMLVFGHDPMRAGRFNTAEPWTPNMAPITREELENSLKMRNDVMTHPSVVASFTGHSHREVETPSETGKICYETPGLYRGFCRLIEIR